MDRSPCNATSKVVAEQLVGDRVCQWQSGNFGDYFRRPPTYSVTNILKLSTSKRWKFNVAINNNSTILLIKLRLVQTKVIIFVKWMSEIIGSDVERLKLNDFRLVQNLFKMRSLNSEWLVVGFDAFRHWLHKKGFVTNHPKVLWSFEI